MVNFFDIENIEKKLGKVCFYKVGPHIFKLKYPVFSDLNYLLQSMTHLLIEDIIKGFDFQLLFFETDVIEVNVPDELLNWENIDPYNGILMGLPDGYLAVCNSHEKSFTWIDKYNKTILFFIPNISFISPNELVAPFRSIFHLWYQSSKYFMCHSAGVVYDDVGLILTAKGGSGKSTCSLAATKYGLNYAGDDFLLIDAEECIAYSLYNVVKLDIPQFEMFKELIPYIENIENVPREKGQVFLTKIYPKQICKEFKIKALVIPVFSQKLDTHISKCSKSDAIKALVPSSLWIMRGSSHSANKMISFIKKLDCYILSTGTDLGQVSEKLKKIIHEN